MKKIIAITLALIPMIISCGKVENSSNAQKKEPVAVKVSYVKKTNKEKILNYSGTIEASKSIPLSFLSIEKITAIYVDEGDRVHKGQLLAETDMERMKSAYQGALAQYNQAIDARIRLKKVYDAGSLPEIKWVEINSKVLQAQANRDMFRKNLENCKLFAPNDGTIGTRNIEVGMTARQLEPPFTLVKIDEVKAKISVPENEINYFHENLNAVIVVSALNNKEYVGKVEKVGVIANRLSRTYDVKISISNPNLYMKPGMVCDVKILLPDTESVLLVPIQSVSYDSKSIATVFTVNANSKKAERKRVQIEGIVDDSISISFGLKENDMIIVEGNHKLSDNALVSW